MRFSNYYDHIMRPFQSYVRSALKLYERFDITLIAPLHGPILRENPQQYIESYRKWSHKVENYKAGKKNSLIFYPHELQEHPRDGSSDFWKDVKVSKVWLRTSMI